jgi:hypothetical protein
MRANESKKHVARGGAHEVGAERILLFAAAEAVACSFFFNRNFKSTKRAIFHSVTILKCFIARKCNKRREMLARKKKKPLPSPPQFST